MDFKQTHNAFWGFCDAPPTQVTHPCPCCKKTFDGAEIRTNLQKASFDISGMCVSCQEQYPPVQVEPPPPPPSGTILSDCSCSLHSKKAMSPVMETEKGQIWMCMACAATAEFTKVPAAAT